ncbi:MAG: primosomal protein N' [Firmicutes bacterium]|nr:primosomal protein N' [Bacillota bacterium]
MQNEFSLYAQVLVDIHARALDKPFTYGIKQEHAGKIAVGSAVKVNFNNRLIMGFVIDISDKPPVFYGKQFEIKPIEEVAAPDSLWDKEMLDLAGWMQKYYGCSFLDALKVLIPAPVRIKKDGSMPEDPKVKMAVFVAEPEESWDKFEKRSPSQAAGLKFLQEQKTPVKLADAVKQTGLSHTGFSSLAKKNLIEIYEGSPSFQYFHRFPAQVSGEFELTDDQQKVLDDMLGKIHSGKPGVAMLYGVTGSGKTEIYLRIIKQILEEGREAIALIPEISLTPQAIERFRSRFGEEIAILHSRLTGTERRLMWWKIRRKEVRVVLGARSAVFAPLENIGVIVVDEEHDESYKQERDPRYNARQVAVKRAMQHNSLVILGSATPSLESFHYAKQKKYDMYRLPARVGESNLPSIELINLKEDFSNKEKRFGLIGDTLKQEIQDTLNKDEQVILFINRRGYSAFIMCRECGNVLRCPYCDITLTYHKSDGLMKCHYCQYERPAPSICPICQGVKLIMPSLGIQEVEDELAEFFPGVPFIRMDKDTTGEKDAHTKIIREFADGKAKILLGTQMIAKGHDFPGVTLVGVILADVSLYLPDFRSLERTYHVLTQVAGRAGRRNTPGKVIIQTYNPKTPVLQAVARQNYEDFFKWEIDNREALNYPPYARIVNILLTGSNQEAIREYSVNFSDLLRKKQFRSVFIAVLGPAPCPLSRIKNRYRWHITIKTHNVPKTVAVVKAVLARYPNPTDTGFFMDIDPVSLM